VKKAAKGQPHMDYTVNSYCNVVGGTVVLNSTNGIWNTKWKIYKHSKTHEKWNTETTEQLHSTERNQSYDLTAKHRIG